VNSGCAAIGVVNKEILLKGRLPPKTYYRGDVEKKNVFAASRQTLSVDPAVEDWPQYVEGVNFFRPNDIASDEKEQVIWLTACAPSAFTV